MEQSLTACMPLLMATSAVDYAVSSGPEMNVP